MAEPRLLVTGGRDYADRAFVFETLDGLHREHSFKLLIHGAATGADSLAAQWAVARGVPQDANPAKWNDIEGVSLGHLKRGKGGKLYDPRAGFIRNQFMLDHRYPTHFVAFPGGTGTDDMSHRVWRAIHKLGREIEFIDLRGGRRSAA